MKNQKEVRQVLSEKAIELIRLSRKCKAKLQYELEVSAPTVQRYLDNNDIMLTTATALNVIRKEIDIKEHEILVNETINA